MYKAIEASTDQDLSSFSRLLWQRRISHRVHRLDELQVLAVPRRDQVGEVQFLYQRWRSGELRPGDQDPSGLSGWLAPGEWGARLRMVFLESPLTLILIAVSLGFALATRLGDDFLLTSRFFYPDFSYGTRVLNLSLIAENFTWEQFLRLFSPMFLHFGLLHIAFNLLWVWELGRRIELALSPWALLALVLVLSLVSNTIQFLWTGITSFGGMSGVVFGLFGYVWMWRVIDPARGLAMPGALVFFMLLSLVLMAVQPFLPIANAAHVGGLLCGVIYGALAASYSRTRRVLVSRG